MGGGSKESMVIDLIRGGDAQAALKILFKNKPTQEVTLTSHKMKRTNHDSDIVSQQNSTSNYFQHLTFLALINSI